jgi:phage/plasmid-associated DNA primase
MAGYALTGVASEHALFFLYATSANGKTTFPEHNHQRSR